MELYNVIVKRLYGHKPKNKKELAKMVSFFKKERDCDLHNMKELESMDTSHLSKTKLKQMNSAVKRWDKDFKKIRRDYDPKHKKFVGYFPLGKERTWLM